MSSPVPWMRIFKSLPVWVIIIAQTFQNIGWYMLLVDLPLFMRHGLGFNIKEVGHPSQKLPLFLRLCDISYRHRISRYLRNIQYHDICEISNTTMSENDSTILVWAPSHTPQTMTRAHLVFPCWPGATWPSEHLEDSKDSTFPKIIQWQRQRSYACKDTLETESVSASVDLHKNVKRTKSQIAELLLHCYCGIQQHIVPNILMLSLNISTIAISINLSHCAVQLFS